MPQDGAMQDGAINAVDSTFEGEIPCVIVYPDRVHVDYIHNILNPLEELLKEKGFKVYLLSDEILPDKHFGKTFEVIAQECALGVVIFDGLRPNVLFEYGLLRGMKIPIIPLQDKQARIALKSLYPLIKNSNAKEETGLTLGQFDKLKEPPVGYFTHLSDRHGIKVVTVDCGAPSGNKEYPKTKIAKELEKLMPEVVKRFSSESIKPAQGLDEKQLDRFHSLSQRLTEYYLETKKYKDKDIERAVSGLERLEKSSSQIMPARVYGLVASLYTEMAEKGEKGKLEVEKSKGYYQKAIVICEKVLDSFKDDEALTGETLIRLGSIYWNLSKYSDRKDNSNNAINAYNKALKVRSLEAFPMDYAMIQNNLGSVYRKLAEVEDKAKNIVKAIDALKEALNVCAFEPFPMEYGMIQNNIGTAYGTLAGVEDKVDNSRKAIKALKKALKVRILEAFPVEYAMTQNNLGNAYVTLAEVKDKAENSRKAIKAYNEALRVGTLEAFPLEYAQTQNNLGAAYVTLAEIEDKAKNSRKAIKALKKALKVRTLESFPIEYATTQNNLGIAYKRLAKVVDKGSNYELALEAYNEAQKVFTLDNYPEPYKEVADNLKKLKEFMESD